MSASGRFFISPSALRNFIEIFLTHPSFPEVPIHNSDALGILIRLCEFAEYRKTITSFKTGLPLETWRIYYDCVEQLEEIPDDIWELLDCTMHMRSGIKMIIDQNRTLQDSNGRPALPGVIRIMGHRGMD